MLNNEEVRRFQILCLVPLLAGALFFIFGSDASHLRDFVATGQNQLSIGISKALISVDEISQTGPISPELVIINEATHEELVACPGISSKTAQLILLERRFAPFFDWRDLQSRVKNIGPGRIQTLQDAGVRLSRNEKEN